MYFSLDLNEEDGILSEEYILEIKICDEILLCK